MPLTADINGQLYAHAWYGLLILAAIYIAIGAALRWQPQHIVRVTRYDPPEDISPAMAAVLIDHGRCDRAFAVALVSLAAKGYIRIAQAGGLFTVEKSRDLDRNLTLEESVIVSSLFPTGAYSYSFREEDSLRLFGAYRNFRAVMEILIKEWISAHVVTWLAGVTCSVLLLEPIVLSTPNFGRGMSLASIGFMVILVIVGLSCLMAALRVWSATFAKIASLASASGRSRHRLNFNDAIPIFLTGPALLGFASLAVLTSTKFTTLAAAAIAMNVLSRYLLNAPTNAGRKTLAELSSFREFLAKTEADRMDRENAPGASPQVLDPRIAYAVALGVERSWGKEFADNVTKLVQFDSTYNALPIFPDPDERPGVLKLFGRKK
jgi:hypothetical protein